MPEHGEQEADGRLLQVDATALQEESLEETQSMLDGLQGKTIGYVRAEKRRIVIETTEGNRFYFGGLLPA